MKTTELLLAILDRRLTKDDIAELNQDELRELTNLLHHWHELCEHRIIASPDRSPTN